MAEPQKSIFVTGAGSGIGRATAKLFADRGWFVGLFDVNQAGLDETAAMLPGLSLNASVAHLESDVLELKEDFENPTAGAGATSRWWPTRIWTR